jgi:pyruvate,water dikinase
MGAAISFKSGAYEVFTGKEVEDVEKRMENALLQNNIVKGRMAFPGVVKGRVKIVFNPREYTNFEQGDILVTGMTRPEYVHLIEKSGAFITDAGGMLSHAAIVARELRKPCVVGTEVATKIFKDGDLIEVDAENGIIRKL